MFIKLISCGGARSIHDSLCVVQRTLESGYVVPGGGASEIALNVKLEHLAQNYGTKEQEAISRYAEALTIIPQVLANNAAQDATDLVCKLKSIHEKAQSTTDPKYKDFNYFGLDLINGKVTNQLTQGVLEPLVSKIKCIR